MSHSYWKSLQWCQSLFASTQIHTRASSASAIALSGKAIFVISTNLGSGYILKDSISSAARTRTARAAPRLQVDGALHLVPSLGHSLQAQHPLRIERVLNKQNKDQDPVQQEDAQCRGVGPLSSAAVATAAVSQRAPKSGKASIYNHKRQKYGRQSLARAKYHALVCPAT